jgi:hypothetical protein
MILAGTSGPAHASVKATFGISSSDEEVCSNFRLFSYSIESAISVLQAATNATPLGLRSGPPAPPQSPGSRQPAGPSPGAGRTLHSYVRLKAAQGLKLLPRCGDLVGERLLERPSKSLALDNWHIRFSQRYRSLPEAPRTTSSDFLDWWSLCPRSPQGTTSRPEPMS